MAIFLCSAFPSTTLCVWFTTRVKDGQKVKWRESKDLSSSLLILERKASVWSLFEQSELCVHARLVLTIHHFNILTETFHGTVCEVESIMECTHLSEIDIYCSLLLLLVL